ncbi:GXGXG motif protein [Pirellula sp. SH-Sr6A]|uniref:GltB/FmdC/FwdC-like GXGXG domain-containing protein n=1 Tax=Pirellula sp. SH-Sr6A TaxID=1632865 RepID=UPI00078DE8FC|nr:hypothetical protein [Pirellula sp. SH-Sr6A]AMV34753.1 GXGXG motif protein [Pirellula sp. SH-Sr6A]
MPATVRLEIPSQGFEPAREALRALDCGVEHEIEICCAKALPYLLNGYRLRGHVKVLGSVGDFCFVCFGESEGIIEGNAGHYLAHSIHSGALFVHGDAGSGLASLGQGGLVSVYGNAGPRVALGMQGADVVIRGNAGPLCGLGMQSGSIVIGGNAGEELGRGMRGGIIYVRGEVQSISPDIEEVRMREPDKLKIGLLMLKAGIKATGKEFKVFRPAH